MKWYSKVIVLSLTLVIVYATIYHNLERGFKTNKKPAKKHSSKHASEVRISAVVCGESRTEEIFTMIKSALVFASPSYPLKFLIASEEPLFQKIREKLESFQSFKNFSFILREVKFPEPRWRKLFKLCASQRLFLPSLFSDIDDSILYVDSDTIFLSPPHDIFGVLRHFSSSHIAGLTQESENKNTGWYSRFARHPFYGRFGINSGVMLMNLTQMRAIKWEQQLLPIYEKYHLNLVFGDQDIINIYFHFHPEQLFLLPCEYNYRPDHCMYISFCKSADKGIKLIHGNRGYFHKAENQPIFSQIYNSFQKYQLNTNPCQNIIQEAEYQIRETNSSNCNKLSDMFLLIPKKILGKHCENLETD